MQMRQKTCGPFHSSQNLPLAFITLWPDIEPTVKKKKIKPTCILGLKLKLTMKVLCQLIATNKNLTKVDFYLENFFMDITIASFES